MDTNHSDDMNEEEFTALKDARQKELANAKAEFLDYVEERTLFSSREENGNLWTEISAAIMQTGDGDVLAHLDQFYTVMVESPSLFLHEEVIKVYPSFLDEIDHECKKIVAQGEGSDEHRVMAGCMSRRVNEMQNRFTEGRSQSNIGEVTKEPTNPELGARVEHHSKKRPAPGSVPLGDSSRPTPLPSAQSYAIPKPMAMAARPPPPTGRPPPPTNRPAPPTGRPAVSAAQPLPPTGRPTGQPALPAFPPMPSMSRPSTRILPSFPMGQIPPPIGRGRLPTFVAPSSPGQPPAPPKKFNTVPQPPAKSQSPSNKASRPPPPLPQTATKPSALTTPAQKSKLQEGATGSFNAIDGDQAPSQNQDGAEPSTEEASSTTAASKTSEAKQAGTDVAHGRSSQKTKKRLLGHCKVCVDPRQPKTCFGIDKATLRVVHEDFRKKGFRMEPYVLAEYWDVTDSDEA